MTRLFKVSYKLNVLSSEVIKFQSNNKALQYTGQTNNHNGGIYLNIEINNK